MSQTLPHAETDRALRRRVLASALGALAMMAWSLGTPASSQAANLDFCGAQVPSGNYCNGAKSRWYFTSTSAYLNLASIRAVLFYSSTSYQTTAGNSSFTYVCHYTPYDPTPSAWQNDGVARTLNGHADDSGNHTGCI